MELISRISLDPCNIPNEKIKINPKIVSKLSGNKEVTHNPKKLSTIEKL